MSAFSAESIIYKAELDKPAGVVAAATMTMMARRIPPTVIKALEKEVVRCLKASTAEEDRVHLAKSFEALASTISVGDVPFNPFEKTFDFSSVFVEVEPGSYRIAIADLLTALRAGGRLHSAGGI